MKKLLICLLVMPFGAHAAELILGLPSGNDNPGWGNGQNALNINAEGQPTQTLQAGEDQTNGVQKVEQQFSYKLTTADAQAKDAPGFVHTVTCATAAGSAATPGTVSIHDALTETTPTIATIALKTEGTRRPQPRRRRLAGAKAGGP